MVAKSQSQVFDFEEQQRIILRRDNAAYLSYDTEAAIMDASLTISQASRLAAIGDNSAGNPSPLICSLASRGQQRGAAGGQQRGASGDIDAKGILYMNAADSPQAAIRSSLPARRTVCCRLK